MVELESKFKYSSIVSVMQTDFDSTGHSALVSPPSLRELSRMIHMNDFKLKRLFKEYFGKTVYQGIRDERNGKGILINSGWPL